MVSEWVELNNGMRILKVRIPDSRPPEVRKMLGYANTLRGLLKSDFLRYLKGWALSADDIENLLCVMQRYPRYAINGQQMKWLEEYKESLSVVPDAKGERSYSGGLLDFLTSTMRHPFCFSGKIEGKNHLSLPSFNILSMSNSLFIES